MNKIYICFFIFLISRFTCAQHISNYDVIWDSPSENSAGSMPIGNGILGMNVWVEKNSDLLFFLSHTDAYSELNRLLKLGRIRISFTPNPFEEGNCFSQRLNLEDGVIEISAGKDEKKVDIQLFLDSQDDVAYMTYKSKSKYNIKLTSESWRRTPHQIMTESEMFSSWSLLHRPDSIKAIESADVFYPERKAIAWSHYNATSLHEITMKVQSLETESNCFPDSIINRQSGIYLSANGMNKINDSTLVSNGAVSKAVVSIISLSKQVKSPDEWIKQIRSKTSRISHERALANSKKRWHSFWNQSYLFVDIPSDKEFGYRLTQAYLLQRYLAGCGGRGNFPISFNGSIFTTDPQFTDNTKLFTPDYRNWGGAYWFQNTRLFYYPMLASGDFDLMHSMIDFYYNRLDAFKTIANKCWNAKGIVIPETVISYGTYCNSDFGWKRDGKAPNEVESGYIKHYWNQGLEISKMMLDYFSYTKDTLFLSTKALPFIKETVLFFDSKFTTAEGKMRITPTQVLETYWNHVVNDMPCVAGLHTVVNGVMALPDGLLSESDKTYYQKVLASLPALPMKNTVNGTVFCPASEYLEGRTTNREDGELYVVFPFGLSNFSNDLKDVGIESFNRRVFYNNKCWGYDGPIASVLGLTDDCVSILREKIEIGNDVNHRFPIMWGNADWVPDQDYGGNLLTTLQNMVLQSYDGKVYLLPAFPKDWNVKFKLHAKDKTQVEGAFVDGKLQYKQDGIATIITDKK